MNAPANASPPSSAPSDETTFSFWAMVAAGSALVLNALFYFGTPPSYRAAAWPTFALCSVAVIGAYLAAAARPREVGHALAALFALGSLAAGAGNLVGGGHMPGLLALVLALIGPLLGWFTFRSFTARSRLSWAFAASLLGVIALCTLFGAPKIRNLMGSTIWTALLLPGLSSAATVALSRISAAVRTPTSSV